MDNSNMVGMMPAIVGLRMIKPAVSDSQIQKTLRGLFYAHSDKRSVSSRWLDSLIDEAARGVKDSTTLEPFAGFIQRLKAIPLDTESSVEIASIDIVRLLNVVVIYRAEKGIEVKEFDYSKLRELAKATRDSNIVCDMAMAGFKLQGSLMGEASTVFDIGSNTVDWTSLARDIGESGISEKSMIATMPTQPPAEVLGSLPDGIYPDRHSDFFKGEKD